MQKLLLPMGMFCKTFEVWTGLHKLIFREDGTFCLYSNMVPSFLRTVLLALFFFLFAMEISCGTFIPYILLLNPSMSCYFLQP